MKKLFFILSLIYLIGCTTFAKQRELLYQETVRECGYDDPKLDPIRDKVVFLYTGEWNQQNDVLRSNRSYPTQIEKVAIKLWMEKRDECNRDEHDILLLRNKIAIDNLIELLYAGKITYGKFALYRENIAQISLDIQAIEQYILRHNKELCGK